MFSIPAFWRQKQRQADLCVFYIVSFGLMGATYWDLVLKKQNKQSVYAVIDTPPNMLISENKIFSKI